MALGVGKNVASTKKKKKKNPLSARGIWKHEYSLIKAHFPCGTDFSGHLQRDKQRTPYTDEQKAAGNGF